MRLEACSKEVMLGWLPDGTMRETGEGSFKHDAVICELGVSSSEKTKQWLFCGTECREINKPFCVIWINIFIVSFTSGSGI